MIHDNGCQKMGKLLQKFLYITNFIGFLYDINKSVNWITRLCIMYAYQNELRFEMVLFDMKCLAVLHSQFKDALCLLKIVIILYEHKCTWERSIQQITNVTQKIDQLID